MFGLKLFCVVEFHSLEPWKLRQSILEPKFYVKVHYTLLVPEFHYIMFV